MRKCSQHDVELVLATGTFIMRGAMYEFRYWQCPVCGHARSDKYTMPREVCNVGVA